MVRRRWLLWCLITLTAVPPLVFYLTITGNGTVSEWEPSRVVGSRRRESERIPLPREVLDEPWVNRTFIRVADFVFVFFAMDDQRTGNMGERSVRMLTVKRTRGEKTELSCLFGDEEVLGTSYEMAENHAMEFGVYLISCAVPEILSGRTVEEVFVKEKEGEAVHVPISYIIPDERSLQDFDYQLAICTPLIYGGKYTGEDLIEFVELNRLLGYERINIYVDSNVDDGFRRVAEHYHIEGILQVEYYHEPVPAIWYHGQLALVADCLARHTTTTKYVAFQDLDEYVIPLEGGTVLSVIEGIADPLNASFRIPTQVMTNADSRKPSTLYNIKGTKSTDSTFTKCVIRPSMVFEQGIHHTSRGIQDEYTLGRVSPDILRVFHFRRPVNEQVISAIPDHYPELAEIYKEKLIELNLV